VTQIVLEAMSNDRYVVRLAETALDYQGVLAMLVKFLVGMSRRSTYKRLTIHHRKSRVRFKALNNR
jgi:hypothetical protein